jgi:hypothetical protein
MEFKFKLVVVAVLALLAGTAFAAPMLVVDVRPFPRIPEGPKVNFNVDIVYANFTVIEVNATEREVAYTIVANITNLSDKVGYLYETGFIAAQHVKQSDSALGGMYIDRYPDDLPYAVGRGGLVDGIYLDGGWLNKTWIPGTDYPSNLKSILHDEDYAESAALPAIPVLPENASQTGIWIEGVPIAEYYGGTGITATHIYVNGSWVDVTGRVQPHNPQPFLLSTNPIVNMILTPSVGIYANAANTVTTAPLMGWQKGMGNSYQYIGGRGFDRSWMPYQSRLIIFNGTIPMNSGEFNNRIAEILENGAVDIYGSATSYINDKPIDDTFTNTCYTATAIKTVTLQKNPEGYLYNAALAPNQHFQVCPDGVEVYIKQVGE